MAVLRTVPPHVPRVPALEAAPVLQLPLVLLHVFVFVVLLLLDPEGQTRGWVNSVNRVQGWFRGCWRPLKGSRSLLSSPPASLWTVLHVVSNLPADPAASVVGRQLAVCQHLGVKEVVLQQKTVSSCSPLGPDPPDHSPPHHFCAGDGIEGRSEELPPIYKGLHDEVCHCGKATHTLESS